MTLPVSGAISFNAINVELGVAGTTTASLGQASYRTLAGVPSGAISLANFYGKTNRVVTTVTISANTNNYVANTAKVAGYVAGKTDVTFVINSGVTVGSGSTGSYAFAVDTSWAAGDTVRVTNAGQVLGAGGKGGAGGNCNYPSNITAGAGGASGGPAISVARATTWTNTGTVGGAGGGGGGGGACYINFKGSIAAYSGGGGGGGRGQNGGGGGSAGSASGGNLGSPGNYVGGNGTAGTSSSAGTGGARASDPNGLNTFSGAGGAGGSIGASGASGNNASPGPYTYTVTSPGGGGGSGAALVGKSFVNSGAGISGGTVAGAQV